MHRAPSPRPSLVQLGLAALALVELAGRSAHAQRGFPIPIPGASARAATPFELAIARGDRALNAGRLDEAQAEFTRASSLDTRDPRPAFYLGEVLMRRERWADAEARFSEALARNPNMAEAHAERGNALRELGRDDDARAALEQAVRLDVTLWEARVSLGLLHEDAGRTNEALAQYRAAMRHAPDQASPAMNLGLLLARSSPAAGSIERAEAFRALQAALRAAPQDRDVLVTVAPGLRMLGESARAVEVLERARGLGAPTPGLLIELAQALWSAGRRPEALTRIDEAVAVGSSVEARYARALMRAESGNTRGATEDANEVLRAAPVNGPLATRARALLGRLGAPRSATPSASAPPPARTGAR